MLMNRYTVVGDESDHKLNIKIEIKYNIVCYKFYERCNMKFYNNESSPWEIDVIIKQVW